MRKKGYELAIGVLLQACSIVRKLVADLDPTGIRSVRQSRRVNRRRGFGPPGWYQLKRPKQESAEIVEQSVPNQRLVARCALAPLPDARSDCWSAFFVERHDVLGENDVAVTAGSDYPLRVLMNSNLNVYGTGASLGWSTRRKRNTKAALYLRGSEPDRQPAWRRHTATSARHPRAGGSSAPRATSETAVVQLVNRQRHRHVEKARIARLPVSARCIDFGMKDNWKRIR